MKFMSWKAVIKLLNPTKVLLAESPPHFKVDIQKTLIVGIIMNTVNKIVAGARQIHIKRLFSFVLFIFFLSKIAVFLPTAIYFIFNFKIDYLSYFWTALITASYHWSTVFLPVITEFTVPYKIPSALVKSTPSIASAAANPTGFVLAPFSTTE